MADKAIFRTLTIIVVLLFTGFPFPVANTLADSGDGPLPPLQGKPVQEVLEAYTQQGLNLLFSTNFIPPTMLVKDEPLAHDPVQVVEEILSPHGLKLNYVDGIYLVVKISPDDAGPQTPPLLVIVRNPPDAGALDALNVSIKPGVDHSEQLGPGLYEFFPSKTGEYVIGVKLPGFAARRYVVQVEGTKTKSLVIDLQAGQRELETMTVSASRYLLQSNSKFVIDQKAMQTLPHSAEDPIRSVHRLPGIATSGFSARSHFRGGLLNESSIYLNGAQLLEPFHIRDFHSIFSSIDARAIASIEVYTGGLPIEYGGDMSGITRLESKIPGEALHTELGLSFFYTSALNSGHSKDARYDWLVSARRSNLNLVLNPSFGDPEYIDVFTALGFNPSANTRISFNALYTDDEILIFTENNPDQLESSDSKTRNQSAWLRMENSWGDNLSADTSFISSYFSNHRLASVNDPLQMLANVRDNREVTVNSLKHAMQYAAPSGHILRWGLEFSHQSADYNYAGQAEYFVPVSDYAGVQNPVAYVVNAKLKGNAYAVFISDQFNINNRLSLDLGMRWDKQTYTVPEFSSQLSPRASALYTFAGGQELRFSLGRFYQAQRIQEMQVEDDIDHFFAPQYSDQAVAGYQWTNPSGYEFRVEAYYKRYKRLAPRFENLYDPMQVAPEFQLDRVRLDPLSADAKGLELSVEYGADEDFSWWASYTLSRATDNINGVSERRSWDQLHALQFGLGWQKDAWEIGFATRIHTGWPTTALALDYTAASAEPVLVVGPRNAERFTAFANLDFRISRHFDVHIGQLTAFLEVINSTNRDNPCCTEYTLVQGPDGNTSLNGNTEYWFPIIPSIGLFWEF